MRSLGSTAPRRGLKENSDRWTGVAGTGKLVLQTMAALNHAGSRRGAERGESDDGDIWKIELARFADTSGDQTR